MTAKDRQLRRLLEKGDACLDKNKYEEALAALEKALQLKPKDPEALVRKAFVLGLLGRDTEALRAANAALRNASGMTFAWVTKGRILGFMGRNREAIRSFNRAIIIDSKYGDAWFHKAESLRSLDRNALALKALDKATELTPNHTHAWFLKSEMLAGMRRYSEALKAVEKAIDLDQSLAAAWRIKGRLLLEMGSSDDTLVATSTALKLNTKDENAWADKGTILIRMKRFEEALAAFDEAVRLAPDYTDAWSRRAGILTLMGKYDQALGAFDKALNLAPGRAAGPKSETLQRLGLYAKSAMTLNPRKSLAMFYKGVALAGTDRLTSALDAFRQAGQAFEVEGDKDRKRLADSWIGYVEKRMGEEAAKTQPSPEVVINRSIRTALLADTEDDPLTRIRKNKKALADYFAKKRTISPPDCFVEVLRRWNSYTPMLPGKPGNSNGGGYFLVWKGKGIVVDPGFGFMANFEGAGFSIRDIDSIVLTHAHTDHTAEFEIILDLLHQLSRHDPVKVDLFMNLGTMTKFGSWIHAWMFAEALAL